MISKHDILAVVADGEWHTLYDFMHLADSITPERACRAYVNMHGKRRPNRSNRSFEQQVAQGRRRIVLNRLGELARQKVIDRRLVGQEYQFRIMTDAAATNDEQGQEPQHSAQEEQIDISERERARIIPISHAKHLGISRRVS